MPRQRPQTGHSLSRRQIVKAAGASLVASPLWGLDKLRAALDARSGGRSKARIRSCIIVFYYGGPSHLDTFDMKPNAPSEVRGEFKSIASSAAGIRVSEHLPFTSKIMHKVAVIRSMHHTNRLHDSASTEALTGRQSPQGDREEFAPIPQFYPCYGSALSYLWRSHNLEVPHAALPWMFNNVVPTPCQGGGFLGSAYDPFRINGNGNKLTYSAKMFARPADLTISRLENRRELVRRMNAGTDDVYPASELRSLYGKALDLMQSQRVINALDITKEDIKTRERYGNGKPPKGAPAGASLRGQNLLLARRLIEAGVRLVNVYDFRQQGQNWDSHNQNFKQHKDILLPQADRAFSALVNDLDDRGLLDETLVIGMGEFGRTPKINGNAGRDHWPDCYSITLAGGGVRGGTLFGASDKLGAYPVVDPVTPADLAATIYWLFGVNPRTEVHDRSGRPHRLADGSPLKALFA